MGRTGGPARSGSGRDGSREQLAMTQGESVEKEINAKAEMR